MKKLTAFVLTLAFMFGMTACTQPKYKVTIADNYPIVNELKSTYAAGEEVTIQLAALTEHYYELYVNGVRQEMNRELSAWDTYTYFTFTMPEENVLVRIEDCWVEIPEGPQQPSASNRDEDSSQLLDFK